MTKIGWALGIVLVASLAWAAGLGTITEEAVTIGSPSRYEITWTSATNTVTRTTAVAIRGELVRVTFTNGPAVVTGYDVALIDDLGVDVLRGEGTNLVAGAVTTVVPGIARRGGGATNIVGVFVNSRLRVSVANAGTNRVGKIVLFVR
jgi:hypothetical protein